MKVQIHHTEVSPLVKEGYDKVYNALRKLLPDDEFIFAKWQAGFGDLLQWSLPAEEKWMALTQADPIDRDEVIAEFIRLRDSASTKLGKNATLIKNVYSVPSENFVYYNITPEGKYRVMLTAWGYTYPRQMPMVPIVGSIDPTAQPVKLRFVDAGQPLADVAFDVPRPGNRVIHRVSDAQGENSLGALMPGSAVDIMVPSRSFTTRIEVVKGKEYYTVDLTPRQEVVIPPVTPPVEPPVEENPFEEEVAEEVIARNRDISVRFFDSKGQPVTGAEVEFSAPHRPPVIEGLDEQGYAYLDKDDFPVNSSLTASLSPAAGRPAAKFVLEKDETQYEIYFRETSSSNVWLEIGAWVLAAAMAYGALCMAAWIGDELV